MRRDRGALTWAGLLLGLLAAGCGSGKGTITGEVKYDGKPIAWGRITFVCQSGKQTTHYSRIIKGQYKIEDCPTGPVKISIESFEAKAPPKGADMMVQKSKEMGYVEPPADVIGKEKYVNVPSLYSDPEQSGEEFTVKRGENTYNIDLKRK